MPDPMLSYQLDPQEQSSVNVESKRNEENEENPFEKAVRNMTVILFWAWWFKLRICHLHGIIPTD